MTQVEIHYRRPPDRLDVYVQELVVDRPDYKVTLHERPPLSTALSVGDRIIFEPGAPIIWFVFPDVWHDLGRFHLKDGTFTGYFVNLITPPQLEGRTWKLFDLCLDLWIDASGEIEVLDQDEFDEAVDHLWIDAATARRARFELQRVITEVRADRWPPPAVREYDLERVRSLLPGSAS